MGNKPRISVIMPVFNCEHSVGESIKSNLNQTFQDWEMLIADDGSSDRTRAIIDQYTDPRIHGLHNDTNLGVLATRNKLLQEAQGDLIAWLDADDIAYPERLEKLNVAFDTDPNLMLCGSNVIWQLGVSGDRIVTNFPQTHEEIMAYMTKHRSSPFKSPSTAFRREVLDDVPGYRPFFSILDGDVDFILRVSEIHRVGNLRDVLYEFRYTRNSTSRKFVDSSYLKLYLPEILFFLKDQREQNKGLDGLMDGGNKAAFERFLEDLKTSYMRDKSITFRQACKSKLSHQDYVYALLDAARAIRANSHAYVNYRLFIHIVGSLVKALMRRSRKLVTKTQLLEDA